MCVVGSTEHHVKTLGGCHHHHFDDASSLGTVLGECVEAYTMCKHDHTMCRHREGWVRHREGATTFDRERISTYFQRRKRTFGCVLSTAANHMALRKKSIAPCEFIGSGLTNETSQTSQSGTFVGRGILVAIRDENIMGAAWVGCDAAASWTMWRTHAPCLMSIQSLKSMFESVKDLKRFPMAMIRHMPVRPPRFNM